MASLDFFFFLNCSTKYYPVEAADDVIEYREGLFSTLNTNQDPVLYPLSNHTGN